MRAAQALDPVEVQFTDEEDVKRYTDRWWRYDESAIIRLPTRRLIELEAALGMPLVDVMNGVRLRTVLGDLAGAWVAVHLADPETAGPFDDFTPLILLAQWRPAQDDEGKAPAGTEETPTDPATQTPEVDGYPVAGHQPPTISGQMDTVVLQSLPAAE